MTTHVPSPNGPVADRIGFCLLTGFLGAGKTTLLRRLLQEEGMGGTAVIINEFGEAGLDHILVREVAPDVVQLPNGCLCCALHRDLAETLRGLVEARDAGDIPDFTRVVLETSGMADPAPILATLSADPFLDHLVVLDTVATVVDPALIGGQVEAHPEALVQVAVADVLLLSRTDLVAPDPALGPALAALNPGAEQHDARALPRLAPVLFGGGAGRSRRVPAVPSARHSHGVTSLTLEIGDDLSRLGFARLLSALAAARGEDLLRVKGLMRFTDAPGRAAAIHAVQHTVFAPDWFDDWPDADPRGRLVFIGRHLEPEVLTAHFATASARPWQPMVNPSR